VEERQATDPLPSLPAFEDGMPHPARILPRWLAAIQVIIVCGIPTQLLITGILTTVLPPFGLDQAGLSFGFFAILTLADTILVVLLIHLFLRATGERPADVFVGSRPIRGEVLRGLALVPVVFLGVTGIVLSLRALVPWTHTVAENPFESFLGSPMKAAVFVVVVVLGGGVREELQRAFVLHRFAQRLGGVRVGLAIFSLTFGALHLGQGVDIAIAVGLLGFLWGVLYVRRRSAVLAMVNHGAFDAVQVVQGMIAKALGA